MPGVSGTVAVPWLRMSPADTFAGRAFTVVDPCPTRALIPCDVPVDKALLPGAMAPSGWPAVDPDWPSSDRCIDPVAAPENIIPNTYRPALRVEIAVWVDGDVSTQSLTPENEAELAVDTLYESDADPNSAADVELTCV